MAYIIMSDKFEKLCEITKHKSILWHELYLDKDGTGGDFKMELPAEKYLPFIAKDYYIINTESVYGKFGIIDTFQVKDTEEDGSIVTVSGFMGESILQRRVIFPTLSMSGTLDEMVETIISRNVTDPANQSRKIENFKYISNPAFDEYLSKQITGANVAKTLVSICGRFGYAYVVRFNADYTGFEMELITGTDRSSSQNENPKIIFSADDFGLTEFTYLTSNKSVFTHVICAGEGYGESRPSVTCPSYSKPSTSGINRREVFLDRQNLSRDQGDDGQMGEALYREKLENEAFEKLQESSTSEACEGIIKPYRYKLYEDFWIGDIVSVENEKYFMGYDIRVLGALISVDENGAQDITAEMGNLIVAEIADDEEPEEDVVEEEDSSDISTNFPAIDVPDISLGNDLKTITVTGCNLQQVDSSGATLLAPGTPSGWVHIHSNTKVEFILTASTRYYKLGSGTPSLGTLEFKLTEKQNAKIGAILETELTGAVFPVMVVANNAPSFGIFTIDTVTRDTSTGKFTCTTSLNIGSPAGVFVLHLNAIRTMVFDEGISNPVAYLENPDTITDPEKDSCPYWLIYRCDFDSEGLLVTDSSERVSNYGYQVFFFEEMPIVDQYDESSFGYMYRYVVASTNHQGYYFSYAKSETAEYILFDYRRSSGDPVPIFSKTGDNTLFMNHAGADNMWGYMPWRLVASNFDVYNPEGNLIHAQNPEDVGCLR